MKKRAIAWGVSAVVFAAIAGVLATTRATGSPDDNGVPLASVQHGDLDLKVYATGELQATHAMVLTAPTVGGGALQITRLLHTGTLVKTGDIVFEFDPAEQRYKLEQSESELLQAEQEIAKAKADAEAKAKAAAKAAVEAAAATEAAAAAEAMRHRKFREGLRADAFSSPGGFDTVQKSLLGPKARHVTLRQRKCLCLCKNCSWAGSSLK